MRRFGKAFVVGCAAAAILGAGGAANPANDTGWGSAATAERGTGPGRTAAPKVDTGWG